MSRSPVLAILFVFALLLMPMTALAVDPSPLPGEVCSPDGHSFVSTPNAAGHTMICEAGTWKSVFSYNATGGLTKLGNQTCATGEILKFNGTSWACAADSSGGGGGSAFNCPAGFTKIEKADAGVLGCMQTAEESNGANYIAAMDDCFDTYGGRLPTWVETHIAFSNYSLTAETDDEEWVADASGSDRAANYGPSNGQMGDTPSTGYNHAYRCFTPVHGGVGGSGSSAWADLTGVPAGFADGVDDTGSVPALPSSQIFVGNGSNVATAVAMSGDATLSNAGVLNITSGAIIGPEIADGSINTARLAANAVDSSKIADGSITAADTAIVGTLTEGKWCTVSGGKIVCTSDAPTGGGVNPPTCLGSDKALQWDGSDWACGTIAGGGGGSGDSTPDTFDFTDVTNALPDTLYEQSVVVDGFTGVLTAAVDSGTAELRRNGTGVWGSSASNMSAGDTLNIRMRSSKAARTETQTATLTIGTLSVDWIVSIPSPNCQTIGQVCGNGMVYAGKSGSTYIFTTPSDQASASQSSGISNCNALTQHGYSDWVLPTPSYLYFLCNNRTAIGGFTSNTTYWSNQFDSYVDPDTGGTMSSNRIYLGFESACFQYSLNSNSTRRIRCVRTD